MKRTGLIPLMLIFILAACQQNASALTLPPEVATLTHPATSPSGQYQLLLVDAEKDGNKVLAFQVQDARGQPVFTPPDQFSTRSKTYFLWDTQDRVWVYAGPTGTFFWQKEGSQWVKYDSTKSSVAVPPFLKSAQPVQH